MEILEDEYCLVCGRDNPIGLKARFETDPGEKSSHCTLQLPREFQGWENVVHGGMLSTLLDEAAIYACRTTGERFVTAELQVRFKKPVVVEQPLRVSARVLGERRRLLDVAATLEQGGELCAEAAVKVFRIA